MSNKVRMDHPRVARALTLGVAVAATALLAGCASMKRDSVVVGSVPQDYRTNHPIVLAEREVTLDLAADYGELTQGETQTIAGFMHDYDRSTGGVVHVMAPMGSANEAAAQRKVSAISAALTRMGVSAGALDRTAYTVTNASANAPVRLAYVRLAAGTGNCGRWPDDLAETSENRNYANFGCAYQKNLAAQLANPTDILGPRRRAPIDATRRDTVLDDWQSGNSSFDPTIEY